MFVNQKFEANSEETITDFLEKVAEYIIFQFVGSKG